MPLSTVVINRGPTGPTGPKPSLPLKTLADASARKSAGSYASGELLAGVTRVEQTDDPDNLWLYAGGDVTTDAAWRGMPKLDASGNILAGGVQIREITKAEAATDVPASDEIVSIEGQTVIGDGITHADDLVAPLMHESKVAAGNTSTATFSTQVGNGNTQAGIYNSQSGQLNNQKQTSGASTQSGSGNTQGGLRGFQSGQSLKDGDLDDVAMFGVAKTAAVGNAIYLWLNNGVRLKPTTAPSTPEAGTIYYDSSANKLKVYNGTAWETVTSAL